EGVMLIDLFQHQPPRRPVGDTQFGGLRAGSTDFGVLVAHDRLVEVLQCLDPSRDVLQSGAVEVDQQEVRGKGYCCETLASSSDCLLKLIALKTNRPDSRPCSDRTTGRVSGTWPGSASDRRPSNPG